MVLKLSKRETNVDAGYKIFFFFGRNQSQCNYLHLPISFTSRLLFFTDTAPQALNFFSTSYLIFMSHAIKNKPQSHGFTSLWTSSLIKREKRSQRYKKCPMVYLCTACYLEI